MLSFPFKMNIVKKCVVPYKSLSVGKHSFEFELHDSYFKAFDGSELLGGEVVVNVEATRGSNVMTLDITIEGEVKVECDRCLEECELPVDYEGDLVVRVSETEDDYEGEIMWISPMQADVDLAQYIYESVVLSLPYQKVHEEDEHGNPMCDLEMLEKFKIVTDQEFEALVVEKEQPEGRNAQWEKLKEIKEKLNK